MTELETGWLAGLLEGEGFFSLERDTTGNHNVTTIRIVLCMTDEDVVTRAARLMEAPSVIRARPKSYKDNYKDQYRTKVSGGRASRVMRAILPYMGTRRSLRIKELLEAYEARSTWSKGALARAQRQRIERLTA